MPTCPAPASSAVVSVEDRSDAELLRDYAHRRSETAFTELVRRHLDLVHSAAARIVPDPQLARDVSQCVFIALARNAAKLANQTVLSGWLHRTTRNLAAKAVRSEVRRHTREQEAATMNVSPEPPPPEWQTIGPWLDQGLDQLAEQDRHALLLRYFERKSAREAAQVLGVSEEAAQKRISRALERLRGFFSRKGVAITSGSLAVLLSAHSVQAAPVGLAACISAVAAWSGPALATPGLLGATKVIAMTTAQKILVTVTVTLMVGAGVYEGHRAARLHQARNALERERASTAEAVEQLRTERDQAVANLASARRKIEQLRREAGESEKLREEVAALRNSTRQLPEQRLPNSRLATATALQSLSARASLLKAKLEQAPDKKIPELQLVDEKDWIEAAMAAKTDSEDDLRKGLGRLRTLAKNKFAPILARGLRKYVQANNGQLPTDMSQLQPYFETPVDQAFLERYTVVSPGNVADLKPGYPVLQEVGRVDQYDSLHSIGLDTYMISDPPQVVSTPDGVHSVGTSKMVSVH